MNAEGYATQEGGQDTTDAQLENRTVKCHRR